ASNGVITAAQRKRNRVIESPAEHVRSKESFRAPKWLLPPVLVPLPGGKGRAPSLEPISLAENAFGLRRGTRVLLQLLSPHEAHRSTPGPSRCRRARWCKSALALDIH